MNMIKQSADHKGSSQNRLGLMIGVCFTILFYLFITYLTRPAYTAGNGSALPTLIYILLADMWIPITWLFAASGFGSLLHNIIPSQSLPHSSTQNNQQSLQLTSHILVNLILGIPAMLFLCHTLGTMGVLQLGGSLGAWLLIAIGCILQVIELIRLHPKLISVHNITTTHIWWLLLLITPALAVLITTASCTPGYLWESEFGGYDVLEYHLQLPREWFAIGSIKSVEHNVYSFLPSFMEAAYYHLAILCDSIKGNLPHGALRAAVPSQLLHALIMLITAIGLGYYFVNHQQIETTTDYPSHTPEPNRALFAQPLVAIALFLGIPWMIITGSMAYNEAPMLLCFVGGLYIIQHTSISHINKGILIGIFCGVACGAKLTAAGFVVIPLLIALILPTLCPKRADERKYLLVTIPVICVTMCIILLPYLIRNWIATGGTNPVFPFATSIFGTAHWTDEQATRWASGHAAKLDLFDITGRLHALLIQGPLHLQWGYLWFIAVFGILITFIQAFRSNTLLAVSRRSLIIPISILIVQLLFWLFFTHLQSRFLIPCAIPLIWIATIPLANSKTQNQPPRITTALMLLCYVILTLIPAALTVSIFTKQRNGAPLALIESIPLRTGVALPHETTQIIAIQNSDVFINIIFADRGDEILLIGDATPYYIIPNVRYHTTWDTSPIGEIIRIYPDKPDQWGPILKQEYNINFLLVNYSELHRLSKIDGWYDPDVTNQVVTELLTQTNAQIIATWPANTEKPVRILYSLEHNN